MATVRWKAVCVSHDEVYLLTRNVVNDSADQVAPLKDLAGADIAPAFTAYPARDSV